MISKKSIYFCVLLALLIFASGCVESPAASQTDQSTWASYVDKPDGCTISYPSNWIVIVDKLSPTKTGVPYLTMEDKIHIYTPKKDGVIQIMGFSYPEELRKHTGIPDAAYDVMVEGFAKGYPPDVIATNVIRDENSYKINGNSARHLQLDLTIDGTPMTSDVYIIRYRDVYYSVSYLTIEKSALKHSSTATEIMKTFKTVAWGLE